MYERKYHKHISARHNWFDLKLNEVWQYRDLIFLFTQKNFTVSYKQTILGPLWLFINPLLTSVMYMVVFGNIAKLGTDGIPQLLFYLSGNALWSYFASCLNGNAATFTSNARLFGKVYFPRLTVPISNVLCSVIRFGIQMLLVVILLGYYIWKGAVSPHWEALLLIFFTFTMAWLHGDGSRDSDLQCDDKIQRSFSTGGLWNVTMDVWHTGGLSNEHFT